MDFGSAALLWFCSKAADAIKYAHGERSLLASDLLARAAELVSGSGYLWELAAAASAPGLLDELQAGDLALTLTLP